MEFAKTILNLTDEYRLHYCIAVSTIECLLLYYYTAEYDSVSSLHLYSIGVTFAVCSFANISFTCSSVLVSSNRSCACCNVPASSALQSAASLSAVKYCSIKSSCIILFALIIIVSCLLTKQL